MYTIKTEIFITARIKRDKDATKEDANKIVENILKEIEAWDFGEVIEKCVFPTENIHCGGCGKRIYETEHEERDGKIILVPKKNFCPDCGESWSDEADA